MFEEIGVDSDESVGADLRALDALLSGGGPRGSNAATGGPAMKRARA
jgi:hypothetical protein